MGITNKAFQKDRNSSQESGASLGDSQISGSNALGALLESLILVANKAEASAIHIYSSHKSQTCYIEVGGKLELTGKKLSDKVLEELLSFVKTSANLETSDLNQAQNGILKLQDTSINLAYIQSSGDQTSHLILNLDGPLKPKPLDDLGLWGRALEDLEYVLDSGKGIVVIDSKDQYAIRSFVNSSLAYLKESRNISSVSFDSTDLTDISIRNHDRIFTKINQATESLARRVLTSDPVTIAFLDTVSELTVRLATEQSEAGKLVFLVTSEGSIAGSLRKMLSISRSDSTLSEIKLVISSSPIQTVGGSNGIHQLDKDTITQLESYFGVGLPESWRSIYSHAGIKSPEELLHLEFPVASEYGGLTSLVEVFMPDDYIKRTLGRNPNLTTETINSIAERSGMMTKREDGLIKALRREVDLADVIEVCR